MTNTQAWNYAVGMIKVDGLEPTAEFKEYIEGAGIYFGYFNMIYDAV